MHYHKIYSSDFSSRRKIGNIIKKDEKGFMGTGNVFTLDGSQAHIYLIIIQMHSFLFIYIKHCIHLFLERGEGREKEREKNINMWLPLACPLLGTWPTTQACALTGNQTSSPLAGRPMLNPQSHISQGQTHSFLNNFKFQNSFKCVEKLQRQYTPHPLFSIVNILSQDGIFDTIHEPILIYYYSCKFMLCLDFLSFLPLSSFCSRAPSRTPHYIYNICPVSLDSYI